MSKAETQTTAPHANICLILEGTFPYVRGGVSTWVKQMIEGMPQLSFSIIFLGADRETLGEAAYELPDNVVHIETHFLLEGSAEEIEPTGWMKRIQTLASSANKKKKNQQFELNNDLHTQLRNADGPLDDSVSKEFTNLLAGEKPLRKGDLEQGRGAWDTIREKYHDAPEGLDFNHFFWTVRSMHAPLFTLAEIVKQAPSADVYHSVSTGYAGYVGAMLQGATGTPYIISEHGIYTKERELDLAQVDWIPEEMDPFKVGLNDNMSYLRSVWIRFFLSLGRMSYSAASQVFTLYEGNRLRQIKDGCPESKLSIIANGVNVKRFSQVRRDSTADIPPVLTLIGRVVPIKDIKNFIRSMQIIQTQLPDAEGWLFGPEDEDEDYTHECKLLVESLGLSNVVKFKGFGNPAEIFPQVGLSVLTSVSEGQPLVVLEGFAAGIPAVTTDVGSCRELIEGASDEDKALGVAGSVVSIADPAAFAEAAVNLLGNESEWRKASAAAIRRVETYYDEVDMIERYQNVYEAHMDLDVDVLGSTDSEDELDLDDDVLEGTDSEVELDLDDDVLEGRDSEVELELDDDVLEGTDSESELELDDDVLEDTDSEVELKLDDDVPEGTDSEVELKLDDDVLEDRDSEVDMDIDNDFHSDGNSDEPEGTNIKAPKDMDDDDPNMNRVA